jgi:tetratricopeptide (TPR) repeat protein
MQSRDHEYVRLKINRRLLALDEWPTQDQSKAGGASRIAEDIARAYSFIGDLDSAKKYFNIAVGFARDELEELPLEEMRADHAGMQYFGIARLYWRAGDPEKANEMFRLALDNFEDGIDHQNESVQLACMLNSVFCMIFSGSYEKATNLAKRLIDLNFLSDEEHLTLATKLILTIATTLSEGDTERIKLIDAEIKSHLDRHGHTLYSASPHPLVDVQEFIRKQVES